MVERRRGLLTRLRQTDFKRFEWLLDELGLVFKPVPTYWERIERKKHLERLTELWCEEMKEHRLDEVQ